MALRSCKVTEEESNRNSAIFVLTGKLFVENGENDWIACAKRAREMVDSDAAATL